MNRAERLSAVLDLLADSGQLEVDDIMTKLGVSAATARRDGKLAQPDLAQRRLQQCLHAKAGFGVVPAAPMPSESANPSPVNSPRSKTLTTSVIEKHHHAYRPD